MLRWCVKLGPMRNRGKRGWFFSELVELVMSDGNVFEWIWDDRNDGLTVAERSETPERETTNSEGRESRFREILSSSGSGSGSGRSRSCSNHSLLPLTSTPLSSLELIVSLIQQVHSISTSLLDVIPSFNSTQRNTTPALTHHPSPCLRPHPVPTNTNTNTIVADPTQPPLPVTRLLLDTSLTPHGVLLTTRDLAPLLSDRLLTTTSHPTIRRRNGTSMSGGVVRNLACLLQSVTPSATSLLALN